MKIQPTPAWSIYKEIFHDYWERFQRYNPRYHNNYYDELVDKMLEAVE